MKKQDGYELHLTKKDKIVQFKFTSEGSKGSIEKVVEFSPLTKMRWNLGFGDIIGDDWSDTVITDNDDLRIVIQTVANAVYTFFESFPDHEVYIEPLDYQRKLLYNRTFQQKWHEIEPIFIVKGIILNSLNPQSESYNPKKLFDLFVLKLRNRNF